MKEMLKSKGIIMFVVMFLGITYVNANGMSQMQNDYKVETDSYIALNTI